MQNKITNYNSVFLRVAIAIAYLSAVADRFGFWGKGAIWGNMENFIKYTAQTNSFLPAGMAPLLGWTATILEITFGVLLITGFKTRLAALGSAGLLFLFATAMLLSFGAKPVFDYAVLTGIAASLALYSLPEHPYSLDKAFNG